MNRPLHIWLVFAACALVLLGAVTWVTTRVLRLERAQIQAQRQADFEEKVRLALWRMDSLLTPMLVNETARPASDYKSFRSAGARSMKGETLAGTPVIPSPLLYQMPPHALLYFECESNGQLTSPDFASGAALEMLTRFIPTQRVVMAGARLAELKKLLAEPAVELLRPSDNQLSLDNRMILSNVAWQASSNVVPLPPQGDLLAANQVQMPLAQGQSLNVRPAELVEQQERAQSLRNSAELQARVNVYQQVAQIGANNQAVPAAPPVLSSRRPMSPVWLGEALVLARQSDTPAGNVIQGVWLDWKTLQRTLLENVRDLLPEADLRAAPAGDGANDGRRLAVLPVQLVPGSPPALDSPTLTSAHATAAFAWGCMLLALLAVALLLHGAVSLSERRGAFVSAVTHELRTPLTTFKMYSEMLAEGMVSEEAKRQQYLQTLRSEANRLSHLVENVLAYARLERGSARTRVERMTLGELVERTLPRLRERTERCDMKLAVDVEESALATAVHVDAAAVEQILFNLVDNACKYAAPHAEERTIHLEALPEGKFAMLRVRDHGAGISAEGARRLFKPFSKSAQEAAHSAPGIGLGLALCRRLSRSLGGELRLVPGTGRGACFELRLPLGAAAN